jgi:hypothetical protein
MKIRNGFVSNSSSSSFVLRGAKFNVSEILEALNMSKDELVEFDDDKYEIFEFFQDQLKDFCVEPTGNFFGEQDYDNLLVGDSIGHLPDGSVTELKEYTKEENDDLIKRLEEFGFKTPKISTYAQMVSNDNY